MLILHVASQENGEAVTGRVARRVRDLKYRLALAALPAGYGGSSRSAKLRQNRLI
jgi:hypothetical protein